MQAKSKKTLKKLALAIVVALGVAIAGYLGLDISEQEIEDLATPLVEDVIDEVAGDEELPMDEDAPSPEAVEEATTEEAPSE